MPEYLECDDCGRQLHELSAEQAQKVAQNPMNFIVLCSVCKREREADMERAVRDGEL